MTQKKNFFISYTEADVKWAEWIAYQLEEAKYNVIFQLWDFRPGSNFVNEMNKASIDAERVIAVLSSNYTESQFAQSEWYSAFRNDPNGQKRKLITVRIENFLPTGLLASVTYIDLVGCSPEEALDRLLKGVSPNGRLKPETPPKFPGISDSFTSQRPTFPPQETQLPKMMEVSPSEANNGNRYTLEGNLPTDWIGHIRDTLNLLLETRRIKVRQEENTIILNSGRSKYWFSFEDRGKKTVRSIGILANKEFKYAQQILEQVEDDSGLILELQKGSKGDYDLILGESKTALQSRIIDNLRSADIRILVEDIINFVRVVEKIKDFIYTPEVEENIDGSDPEQFISMRDLYSEINQRFKFGNRYYYQDDGLYTAISNYTQGIYEFRDDDIYLDKTKVLRSTLVPKRISERVIQHFQKLSG